MTLAFDLGSGRPASMADSRQLRPDALNAVAIPAAGFTPEAPPAIVAALTAPSACGHRSRSTRTTESFRWTPSAWPASQSERLNLRFLFGAGPGVPGLRRSCRDYTQATLTPLPKTVRPRVVIPHPPTPLRFVYGFTFINSAPPPQATYNKVVEVARSMANVSSCCQLTVTCH